MTGIQAKENNPVISVVTPSYNQSRYLAETIESVLGQEGDFYLDYIIVDGGSTDDSVEIIKRYERLLNEGAWQKKCRGISYRWVSEKDNGQTDAIMKGFRLAKGNILAWLNSDDTYLPGALHMVANIFSAEQRTWVLYGRTHFTDEKGGIIGKYPTEPFDYRRLAMFDFVCQPSVFFRRQTFTEAGGLDTSLHYVMDYDLWIRLGQRFDFRYVPEFLSTYRLHEESKTMSPAVALANHKEALETVKKYYGWAPLNRVYIYCHSLLKSKMPPELAKYNVLVVFLSLPFAVAAYVIMNRGIRLDDLKMISPSNIRKLFKSLVDIYKEY
jgi:glycosyltransferase involved in cell wall biosynthesis